jgi:hypothetical protein
MTFFAEKAARAFDEAFDAEFGDNAGACTVAISLREMSKAWPLVRNVVEFGKFVRDRSAQLLSRSERATLLREFEHALREGLVIADGEDLSGIADDPRAVADIAGDAGHAAGHGLADDVGEAFSEGAGVHEAVEGGIDRRHVALRGEPGDIHAEGGGEVTHLLRVGFIAAADDDETGVWNKRGGFEEGRVVLHRAEATDEAESERMLMRRRLEALGVDAVGNDMRLVRRVAAGEVVVATGLGVADDDIGEAGEEAVEAEAEFAERAPEMRIGLRVAHAPHDTREAAEGLQEERHEVRFGEVAVENLRPDASRGLHEAEEEAKKVPAALFADADRFHAGIAEV